MEKIIAINELVEEFKKAFLFDRRRIVCLSQIILSIITLRKVNFKDIAANFPGGNLIESDCKRVKRFFEQVEFSETLFARFIERILQITKFTLVFDRTNWKLGNIHINFLVLGVSYHGYVVPFFQTVLGKAGNSNTLERIDLLQKFINIFGKETINGLLGDREFIGQDWFQHLEKLKIPFCIRVKDNFQIDKRPVKLLFSDLKIGEVRALKGKKKICGTEAYLTGTRSREGELVIIVTLEQSQGLEDYRLRWGIEVLFGCLKSRGFNLEETHLTDSVRLQTLFQVLSIAFVFCLVTGEDLAEKKEIKLKKHGYKAEGLFRKGLDFFRKVLLNIGERIDCFFHFLLLIRLPRVLSRS